MGADVVKINPESRAVTANHPSHPYYVMWNRNKRALALEMSSPEHRDLCRQLCEKADVVIENFSVGVLDRWGIGFDAISSVNPGVIYVQMSGMGEGGPWSKFVTYAPTIHALTGLTHLTSIPGREDIGVGYSYNDHQAGLHAAVAVLAALEARRRTGRGQQVDLSQFEVGVNFAGPALLDWFANGRAARPCGNDLPYDVVAPHGCYRCAPLEVAKLADERWVAIACMTDDQWVSFRQVLGSPDWAADPRFAAAAGRVDARADIDSQISAWTATREAEEVMTLCQAAGVPAGVVQTGADMAERDPQLARSGFLRAIEDPSPSVGQTWADRLPIYFEATPCDDYRRVREVGEDNEAVLKDWLE
jgi:crotonobetainyl-CoA:carnitine CoA-transferase CaiB-like acyl-CoA transferase